MHLDSYQQAGGTATAIMMPNELQKTVADHRIWMFWKFKGYQA